MATAVEPSSQPRTPETQPKLVLASLVGAVYVAAALAVVVWLIPQLWAEYVAQHLSGNKLLDYTLWGTVEIAALVALGWFGNSLAGSNPPKGMRGGTFLMLLAAVVIFFAARAAGLMVDGPAGMAAMAVVAAGLLFGAFRLFTSPRGERWMVGLEEQGWFHGTPYKRVLGRLVRRLTILGILLVGLTGAYSLTYQGMLPDHWDVTLPLAHNAEGGPQTFRLLPDAKYTVPILLVVLTVWLGYRAVNMPAFAEFLIATEAEMNKVSWSSRRRLAQDTVVVLVCTVFMALFLLFVDLFWGWLLSQEWVGVLPSRSQTDPRAGQAQAARW